MVTSKVSMPRPRVLITSSGNNITSSILALLVHQKGYQPIIYDSTTSNQDDKGTDSTLILTSGASKTLTEVGVFPLQCPILTTNTPVNGTNLTTNGIPNTTSMTLSALKSRLNSTMLDRGIATRHGCTLVNLEHDHSKGQVLALFDNSLSSRGSFLIGTDLTSHQVILGSKRIPAVSGSSSKTTSHSDDLKPEDCFTRRCVFLGEITHDMIPNVNEIIEHAHHLWSLLPNLKVEEGEIIDTKTPLELEKLEAIFEEYARKILQRRSSIEGGSGGKNHKRVVSSVAEKAGAKNVIVGGCHSRKVSSSGK